MITPKDLVLIISLVYLYLALSNGRIAKRQCAKGKHISSLKFTDLGAEDIMFRSTCPELDWPDCARNCTWQSTCDDTKEWMDHAGRQTYAAGLKINTNDFANYSQVYCCHSEGMDLRRCSVYRANENERIEVRDNEAITDIRMNKGRPGRKSIVMVRVCENRPVELPMCAPEEEKQDKKNQKQEQDQQKKQPERQNKMEDNKLKAKKEADDAAALGAAVGLPLGVGLGVGLPLGILALITTTTTEASVQCTDQSLPEAMDTTNDEGQLFTALATVQGPWDVGTTLPSDLCDTESNLRIASSLDDLNGVLEGVAAGTTVKSLTIAGLGQLAAIGGAEALLNKNAPCATAVTCTDQDVWTDGSTVDLGTTFEMFCLKKSVDDADGNPICLECETAIQCTDTTKLPFLAFTTSEANGDIFVEEALPATIDETCITTTLPADLCGTTASLRIAASELVLGENLGKEFTDCASCNVKTITIANIEAVEGTGAGAAATAMNNAAPCATTVTCTAPDTWTDATLAADFILFCVKNEVPTTADASVMIALGCS